MALHIFSLVIFSFWDPAIIASIISPKLSNILSNTLGDISSLCEATASFLLSLGTLFSVSLTDLVFFVHGICWVGLLFSFSSLFLPFPFDSICFSFDLLLFSLELLGSPISNISVL